MKRTPTAKITSEKLCWRITKFKRDVSMYFVYVDKINKKKIGQTYGLPSAQKCCPRKKEWVRDHGTDTKRRPIETCLPV